MLHRIFFCLIFLASCLDFFILCERNFIVLPQGKLRGISLVNKNGKRFTGYRGIPYAEPPVGDLKFKPPQPGVRWRGVLNATVEGNACKGADMFTHEIQGDEDCLYMNIYVPETSCKEPLPVFFWIYSGGFIYLSSSASRNGPDYLMDYDIIFVTFNYRLGPLGFLNLELPDAPGNMGLMDQVMALQWVNDNIKHFGGDPTRITIGGSVSVHYHILSDMSSGLFQRAILESGSALNPWAYQRNHIKRAFQLADLVGCNTNISEDALQCLKAVHVDQLYAADMPTEVEGQLILDYIFTPSVEQKYANQTSFLSETPLQKLKSGNFNKVPMITGFNNGEGIMFFINLNYNPTLLQELQADPQHFIPLDLNVLLNTSSSEYIAEQIMEFYFPNKTVPEDLGAFVDVMTDNWFTRGINNNVKLILESSAEPLYYYEYYFAVSPPTERIFGDYNQNRAARGDELVNFLSSTWMDLDTSDPRVVLNQKRFLYMWTNFIKYGNPTPEVTDLVPLIWEPSTEGKLIYLAINETYSLESGPPERERLAFWDDIVAYLDSVHNLGIN